MLQLWVVDVLTTVHPVGQWLVSRVMVESVPRAAGQRKVPEAATLVSHPNSGGSADDVSVGHDVNPTVTSDSEVHSRKSAAQQSPFHVPIDNLLVRFTVESAVYPAYMLRSEEPAALPPIEMLARPVSPVQPENM